RVGRTEGPAGPALRQAADGARPARPAGPRPASGYGPADTSGGAPSGFQLRAWAGTFGGLVRLPGTGPAGTSGGLVRVPARPTRPPRPSGFRVPARPTRPPDPSGFRVKLRRNIPGSSSQAGQAVLVRSTEVRILAREPDGEAAGCGAAGARLAPSPLAGPASPWASCWGGSWPTVVPGGGYCAATRLDLADCGPGPALLMAWT